MELRKFVFGLLIALNITKISYGEIFKINPKIVSNIGEPIIVTSLSKITTNYSIKVSFDTNLTFSFYELKGQSISIVPTPLVYNEREIKISVLKDKKEIFSENISLEYMKEKMKVTKLKLTKSSSNILTNKVKIAEDREYIISTVKGIKPSIFMITDLKEFILPSTNRITSTFGLPRKYSDGKIRYHLGIDFSSEPDDNIYSINDGFVVISSNFLASGNTVYIYHGLGIVTSYFHMSEVYVKSGDYVSKGQVIGKIGNTGIATAKHLHFGMYTLAKGGYFAVDPITLINSINTLINQKEVIVEK